MDRKNVLVSGATGFLGSHLIRALVERGDNVAIFKRAASDTWRIADLISEVRSFNVDIDVVEDAFDDDVVYDALINTAGVYGRKGESSIELLRSNLCFAVELLGICEKHSVRRFINANTSNDRLLNGYALSKRQFSEWGKLYAQKSRMAVYDIIMEHMYGANDDDTKFVEFIINSCLANVPELNLTEGEQERDFIHIDDVTSAYLLLVDAPLTGYQKISLGSGVNTRIRDLVEMIHKLTHSKTKLNFGAIPYREKETLVSHPDLTILHLLGWHAKIQVEQGIRKMLEVRQ